jgi:hypothetical protein
MEYSSIFNKDSYSLLFNNNEVKILYKNELTDISIIEDKNIKLILNKFMKKDLSVKNDCINIPIFINKLFEIICNKENKVSCNDSCHKVLNIALHDTIFNEIFNKIDEREQISLKIMNDYINIHDVVILDQKNNTLIKYIIQDFNLFCPISKIYLMYRFYNFLIKNRFYMDDTEKFRLSTLDKINEIRIDIEPYKQLLVYNEINKVFDEFEKIHKY